MRFQVPQFIDVESKIIGPFTLKQFFYLAGGGGMVFLLKTFLPFFLFVILAIPVAALALALAFYKVNNHQPFIFFLQNVFRHITSKRLYLWKKVEPEKQKELEEAKKQQLTPQISVPKLTQSRLSDLAWSLDIKEKAK
ncbi:MAG: PrgI family protein [Patescibacteria group bacterium]